MGLLSGIEKFGFGKLTDINIYDEEKGKEKEEKEEDKEKKIIQTEKDMLFDKSYECPVCDFDFKAKTVRIGRAKLVSSDLDLRPVYEKVDTLKYDAIVCPKCGFAALTRFFKMTSPTQNKLIRAQITANFKGIEEPEEIYSYDDAINRHKLALMSTVVKRGKVSERAYVCLKIAWLLRGKSEDPSTTEADKRELKVEEKEFLEKAVEGFDKAFSTESFPICGMDEVTLTYLVAAIFEEIGHYEEALRWTGRVVTSKRAAERIKEKARRLKDIIKAAMAEKEENNE